MPYVKTIKAEKIVLPSDPHYFIMWKTRARYGDMKLATKSAVSVDASQGAQATPEFDSAAYTSYAILAHIESWNLDDENGQPLPLLVESIDLLDEEDSNALAARLNHQDEAKQVERKK